MDIILSTVGLPRTSERTGRGEGYFLPTPRRFLHLFINLFIIIFWEVCVCVWQFCTPQLFSSFLLFNSVYTLLLSHTHPQCSTIKPPTPPTRHSPTSRPPRHATSTRVIMNITRFFALLRLFLG